MTSTKRFPIAIAVGAALLCAATAQASLINVSPVTIGGAGLGAVNTVLTITSPRNSTFESGSVGLNATGAQVTSGDVLTGASQTQVRSLSELGISSASELAVVLNANEPAGNSINLTNLVLTIYATDGSVLFNSGAFTGTVFPNTFTGVGNAGFVFQLDAIQAAAAQSQAFTGNFGVNLVGLSAAAADATGGPETFFVGSLNEVFPPVVLVPEPETYAMMLAGLGLLGFVARRRKAA